MAEATPIRPLTVQELKALRDRKTPLDLIDVRTEEERAIAHIEGSRRLDDVTAEYLAGLPKDTLLVFQCHHGIRSHSAARHFASLGFTNVCNLVGGIEAWSMQIDPSVRRY